MTSRRSSALPGVRYGTLERHGDARGSFRELWRASAFGRIGPAATGAEPGAEPGADPGADPRFVQANLSSSAPGVLRGLHVHRRQLDHWTVMSGRAFVALVDLRPAIAGNGPVVVETRELATDDSVTIPAGVAHGFLALEPLDLLYLVTNEYDGTDELGFAWDDPEAAVPWPALPGTADERPIVSDRDRSNPSLVELVAQLRG